MSKVGIFIGKFMPLHNGHVRSIVEAYTKCDELYVLLCCRDSDTIPRSSREIALAKILYEMDCSDYRIIDETEVPEYPYGFEIMCDKFRMAVEGKIDYVFCGESEYIEGFNKFMPEAEVILLDPERSIVPISATMIRSNPYKYWDFIHDYMKGYFTKRVLITGTESCGKSNLVNLLSIIENYDLVREYGRGYVIKFNDGDESTLTDKAFYRIASDHRENEQRIIESSNKKAILFDTDAVVTEYYAELYLGKVLPTIINDFIDPSRYDLVILLYPNVDWIDDGMRLNGDQITRENNHINLKNMYIKYGFGDKLVEITDNNYWDRLSKVRGIINEKLFK